MEEVSQNTANAILTSDRLDAFWEQCFAPEHLTEEEAGGSGVTSRLVTNGKDGGVELMAVGIKVADLADVGCEQPSTKGNKGCAKRFVEGEINRVGEREIGRGKLEAFFGHVGPDASEGGVAVFACSEANGNGCKTKDLTGLDVAEQSVLLVVSGEICENNVAHDLYAPVLREESAVADGSEAKV